MDDLDGVSPQELDDTLRELRAVNRRLGGHSTSCAALGDLLARGAIARGGGPVTVLDVGGGSGDVAEAMLRWGARNGVDLEITIVELAASITQVAHGRLAGCPGVRVRTGNLFDAAPRSFDVVHAALVLHHFDGSDAARALGQMAQVARRAVVVNDLRRHWLPWMLIRAVTAVASRNRLIRNDAPLSVARAFTADDWRRLARETGLDLRWRRRWAFRWAVSAVVGDAA